MILLQYCFCFMLWVFGFQACEILASRPEIKPTPPALEGEVLTTGPPGTSPGCVLLISDAQVFSCHRKEKPDSGGEGEETTGARIASLYRASPEANPDPSSRRLGVPPVRPSPQTRTRCSASHRGSLAVGQPLPAPWSKRFSRGPGCH